MTDEPALEYLQRQIEELEAQVAVLKQAAGPGFSRGDFMLEAAPVGVGVSAEGRVIYTNPRLREMFRYEVGEMLGRHISEFFAAREQDAAVARPANLLAGGKPDGGSPMTGIRSDESEMDVRVWSTSLDIPGGVATLAFIVEV